MHSPPVLTPAGGLVPDVRRIAVLRANALGDFVLTLPALEALRAAYPDAEITLLTATWHRDLLDGRPGPWNRVVVLPPYPGLGSQILEDGDDAEELRHRFFHEQRAHGYDLAVQLHGGGLSSNPLVSALGARVTVGARDQDAAALDRWIRYRPYQHEVVRWLEVVGLTGAAPVALEPRLVITDADRAAAIQLDDSLGGATDFVVMHLGANDPRRRWPVERFAEVADVLSARDLRVVVIGTGEDDAKAASALIGASSASVVNLVDRAPLSATLGVLEGARLLVGNDSGPRHLAEAAGIPTVAVYWVGNLLNVGPLTRDRHRVHVSFRTSCPVCGQPQTNQRCEHDVSFVDDVEVGPVLDDVMDLLEGLW
jgi:ADP-heptose:LPS heptosyltransferase